MLVDRLRDGRTAHRHVIPDARCYGLLVKRGPEDQKPLVWLLGSERDDQLRSALALAANGRELDSGSASSVLTLKSGSYVLEAKIGRDARGQAVVEHIHVDDARGRAGEAYPLTIEAPPPWDEPGLPVHGLMVQGEFISRGDRHFDAYMPAIRRLLARPVDREYEMVGVDQIQLKVTHVAAREKQTIAVMLRSNNSEVGEMHPLTVPWESWQSRSVHAWDVRP